MDCRTSRRGGRGAAGGGRRGPRRENRQVTESPRASVRRVGQRRLAGRRPGGGPESDITFEKRAEKRPPARGRKTPCDRMRALACAYSCWMIVGQHALCRTSGETAVPGRRGGQLPPGRLIRSGSPAHHRFDIACSAFGAAPERRAGRTRGIDRMACTSSVGTVAQRQAVEHVEGIFVPPRTRRRSRATDQRLLPPS